jgi:hypothetical protein
VEVKAKDDLHVFADALAISATISGGISSVSVSVSAAVAENTMAGATTARIGNSRVDADGGSVVVDATSNSILEATPDAYAIAIAASIGLAASGSGASATNRMTRTNESAIDAGSDVTASTLVHVEAHDTSDAIAEVDSIAASGGLLGIAVGVGLATNVMTATSTAHVSDSSVHAEGGEIRIDADATQDVNADAKVVAVTAAIGAAGAGGHAVTDLDSTVEAFARNASLTASDNLFIDADSTHHARAKTFGFGAALGIAVSAMVSEASVGGATRAYADGNTTVTTLDRADITADSEAHALPDGDAIAVGLISGAVTIMDAEVDRVTEAYVGGRAQTPLVADTRLDGLFLDAQEVPFETGEIVTYSSGGGTAIGGLTSGKQYYVIARENGQVQLAEILAEAYLVDVAANTIDVGHQADPFTTGEAVVYRDNVGTGTGASIGGLADGATYYVIDVLDGDGKSTGKIKLATSNANATSDIAIDLTSPGAGDGHEIDRTGADDVVFDPLTQSADQDLASRDAVNLTSTGSGGTHSLTRDASASVISLDAEPPDLDPTVDEPDPNRIGVDDGGLPFQTGEAVVYTASGSAIGGLVSGQTYYAIGGQEAGFVRLAASAEDAEIGLAIDLTGTLPAGTHTLARSDVTPVVFNPAAARDTGPSAISTVFMIGTDKLNVLAGSTYEARADSLTGGFGLFAGATVTKSNATVLGETLAYVGEATSVSAGELDVVATSNDDAHSLNEFLALSGGLTINVTIADAVIDSRTEAFTGTVAGEAPTPSTATVITLTDDVGVAVDGRALIDANGSQTAGAHGGCFGCGACLCGRDDDTRG